ncbi:Protein FecR [compost metagenome]|jgi:transmembrane sensor|uniref:Protein FecR n=1 Tax=Pseudomonas wadenswilerensis TaxID=1785161 RepID=A0A380SV14_9PSED|nr:FecR domain-containing protein [Pseudomonas wadenswilerensis]UVM21273.1 FecR domain-containing protein [Pseudomonas wadenswilerensis]SUQ61424.1 Protein FecR [Pseudomonas wadenswilerensis]
MAQPLDYRTLEAAATWYVQLNAAPPSDAQLQAWQDWLGKSQAHAQAWARVEKLQRQLGRLPADVALPALAGVRARRRAVLKTLALLMAVGATGWAVRESTPGQAWMAELRTGKGQRRQVRLADGSQLELNTDSAVDIRYDGQQRLLRLYSGEIMVQTARDSAARPFIVETAEGRVRALGTRFNVRSDNGLSRVSVLEHAVEVRPLDQPLLMLRLETGQSVSFDRTQIAAASTALPGTGAWTQGMLTVIEWRLGDFISELRRYRPGVLRCAESIADLRLSGAFRIDDTDTVLENLGVSLPVRVRYMTRYWVSIEAV